MATDLAVMSRPLPHFLEKDNSAPTGEELTSIILLAGTEVQENLKSHWVPFQAYQLRKRAKLDDPEISVSHLEASDRFILTRYGFTDVEVTLSKEPDDQSQHQTLVEFIGFELQIYNNLIYMAQYEKVRHALEKKCLVAGPEDDDSAAGDLPSFGFELVETDSLLKPFYSTGLKAQLKLHRRMDWQRLAINTLFRSDFPIHWAQAPAQDPALHEEAAGCHFEDKRPSRKRRRGAAADGDGDDDDHDDDDDPLKRRALKRRALVKHLRVTIREKHSAEDKDEDNGALLLPFSLETNGYAVGSADDDDKDPSSLLLAESPMPAAAAADSYDTQPSPATTPPDLNTDDGFVVECTLDSYQPSQ